LPSRFSRDWPPAYLRLLRWIGLFGAGDFAHSLMILHATSVLASQTGVAEAASMAVAVYALHNICYAASSYPAGWLADRFPKHKLLSAGYALGALVVLWLAWGAGDFVSSLITGWLWSAAGPAVAFGFAGLLMAADAMSVGFFRPLQNR